MMHIKPYEIPYDVNQLIALNRRTSMNHSMKRIIQKDYSLAMAGQYGEKELYYHLQFLPNDTFHVLHNIRLIENKRVFQIDFLIITIYFILLLEMKNLKGHVFFNGLGEFILQKEDGSEEKFDNPINQLERHKLQLQNWLNINSFPRIPIIPFVVLGSAANIKKEQNQYQSFFNKFIPISNALPMIINLHTNSKKTIMNKNLMTKLSSKLVESHIPIERDILQKYNMSVADLSPGVYCTKCLTIPMIRYKSKWRCKKCNHQSKFEHIYTLNDYFLLIGDTITNSQAKHFLQIESSDVVKYLLHKAGLPRIGKNKTSKYILNYIPTL